ncbi:hypothetical protein HDU97_003009 [Phlyctochytrium planicorne]|nr:hypothetical protein HDU97_003009 [Phlyctochytrium planicorne]
MDPTRNASYDPEAVHEEEVTETVHHTQPAQPVAKQPERVIVIAVDETPASKTAFDWAIKNVVKSESDQVIILSARPHAMLPQEVEAARKKGAHAIVRSFADTLPPYKYRVRSIALVGDPRLAITKKSEELQASLVVVGSRNLSTIKKVFLGSVSDYVVNHCSCPVVVARS